MQSYLIFIEPLLSTLILTTSSRKPNVYKAKNRNLQILLEIPVLVPEAGIEPARLLRTQDFESSASTIPPLGQWGTAKLEIKNDFAI